MEKSRKTQGRGRIYLLLMFVEEICIKIRRNKDSLPTILSQQERQLNFLRKKKNNLGSECLEIQKFKI